MLSQAGMHACMLLRGARAEVPPLHLWHRRLTWVAGAVLETHQPVGGDARQVDIGARDVGGRADAGGTRGAQCRAAVGLQCDALPC